ncbi:peroxide stress protein YaaA [Nocardioides limicola]|uniref:peroxide stress protein YaaA n=1 Tax=Nocardioides limicola TaxID=2803368 RepID=UPI00193B2366|nr:peroxide stress protein YaaA [Nocardioides sp. DJM-14]
MLILLPPSEGKSTPTRGRPLDLDTLAHPELTEGRAAVLDALVTAARTLPEEEAAAMLGVGVTQADLVHRNRELLGAATGRADRIYTGVLFDALDLPGLPTAAKRRAATRVAITSALFGLVRPGDRIPAYRLSGDVTLPGLGPVAGHWRRHLPTVLESGRGLLVDLRSTAYAAFWRPPVAHADRVVTVRVLHEHNGTRKVVSHFNKATKGRITRDLLTAGQDARTPAALADLLTGLGWNVESGPATKAGTRLDVVVGAV